MNYRIMLTLILSTAVTLIALNSFAAGNDDDVKKLSDSNIAARNAAFSRLSASGRGAVPALLRGLNESSPLVRLGCLAALRRNRLLEPSDIEALGNKLRGDQDEAVRSEAVLTLKANRSIAAMHQLKVFAESDTSERVRAHAVEDIGRIDARREAAFLRSRLKDSSLTVRLRAMEGLARTGDRSWRSAALQTAATSSVLEEREAAIGVIGATADSGDIQMLDTLVKAKGERQRLKLAALFAKHHIVLMQLKPDKRLEHLVESLRTKGQGVRLWAAGELIERGGPDAIDALMKVVRNQNHIGREEAALALADMGHAP